MPKVHKKPDPSFCTLPNTVTLLRLLLVCLLFTGAGFRLEHWLTAANQATPLQSLLVEQASANMANAFTHDDKLQLQGQLQLLVANPLIRAAQVYNLQHQQIASAGQEQHNQQQISAPITFQDGVIGYLVISLDVNYQKRHSIWVEWSGFAVLMLFIAGMSWSINQKQILQTQASADPRQNGCLPEPSISATNKPSATQPNRQESPSSRSNQREETKQQTANLLLSIHLVNRKQLLNSWQVSELERQLVQLQSNFSKACKLYNIDHTANPPADMHWRIGAETTAEVLFQASCLAHLCQTLCQKQPFQLAIVGQLEKRQIDMGQWLLPNAPEANSGIAVSTELARTAKQHSGLEVIRINEQWWQISLAANYPQLIEKQAKQLLAERLTSMH